MTASFAREFRNRGIFPTLARYKGRATLTPRRGNVEKFPRFLNSRENGKRARETCRSERVEEGLGMPDRGGQEHRGCQRARGCGDDQLTRRQRQPGLRLPDAVRDPASPWLTGRVAPREFRNRGIFPTLARYKGGVTLTPRRGTVEKFPRFLNSRENRGRTRQGSGLQGSEMGKERSRHGRQRTRR